MPAPNAANTISSSGEEAGLGEARKPNGQRRGEDGAGGICGSPQKKLATDSQKARSSEPLAELEGIAVYCVDGAGKQTYAKLRFDVARDSFVCSIEEEGDVVADYSVNDFCRIVEAKLQNTPHSNGGSAASAPKIYVASTGVPINWADLREKVAGRQRSAGGRPPSANGVSANGSARHVGLHGGATGAGNSSKKNSGAARNPTHSRSSWGSAAAKRRRDGGASDSDSDGEATWAKALKESVYNERAEKAETFKQRRQAEQAALNQRFFETSRKKEEPVLGVDVSAPMLPEDMFPSDDEQSILDKGKAVHARLIDKGEETEEDRLKHEQWVSRYHLAAESERFHKVSLEFAKSGTIHVNMFKEVSSTAEDSYDAEITNKWNEDFTAVSWLKMPKIELEVLPSVVPAPRNRSISGGNARAGHGRGDAASSTGYSMDIDDDFGGLLYQPTLESEERQLFEALFACYGPDHRTICRLLCCPNASLEVQDLVAEAAADIRCEVCRNPEHEDLMILCDSCDKGYHIFCLDPPLPAIPEGDWFCESCTAVPESRASMHAEQESAPQECATSIGSHASSSCTSSEAGRTLHLQGLEVQAKEELLYSVPNGEWQKIIKPGLPKGAQVDCSGSNALHEGRLTMEEIQLSPNTSIFSAMLFTCPVPTRLEHKPMAEIITIPLRRHLRIIAAAVKAAFTKMQVNAVRRALVWRAAGWPADVDDGARGSRRGWVIQMSPQLINIEACARKEGALNVLLRRHSNRIRAGDRIFIWKTGKVELRDGIWQPVGGGLVALGHVRSGAEIQALPTGMAAHLRPAGTQLDPWKHTMSCCVAVSHVLQTPLGASRVRQDLQGALLPIFENAVGSVYRLTSAQVTGVEDLMRRHDPSISPEALGSLVGSSGRAQTQNLGHPSERKDKTAASSQRRTLNTTAQESSEEESDGNDLYEDEDGTRNGHVRRPMWMHQGEQLLARLKRQRDARPFLLPVNTTLYPDYPEVLRLENCEPISLADVEDNLESQLYSNHKEFLSDIKRIWKNCEVYNPEKDPMQLMATNMSQETDLIWANCKKNRNKRRRAVEESRGDHKELHKHSLETAAVTPGSANGNMDKMRSGSTSPGVCGDEAQMLQCRVCSAMGNALHGDMLVCNATGVAFHLACMKEAPVQLLDGPLISAHALEGLEVCQLPRAPNTTDSLQVVTARHACGVCKQDRGQDAQHTLQHTLQHTDDLQHTLQHTLQHNHDAQQQSCAGCHARYHTACIADRKPTLSRNKRTADDKSWVCMQCQELLPAPPHSAQMLRALVRREIVFECRRLIHLHCELCSRDRELDIECELHRFRVLKQTAALAKRIFDFNAVLMQEANHLLSQTAASS